jgi:flagellar biosynthesis/type III secretory pathway protein FliH
VTHEVVIAFPTPPAGVGLVDPDLPLPPLASAPNAREAAHQADRDRQWREEQERRWQEDRLAIERALAGMKEAVRSLEEQQQHRLADLRRAAVELGVTIASRLVHEKVLAADFAVETLVQKAIDQLEPQQPVTVRLHPKDKALLEQRLGAPLLHDAMEVRVVADAGLDRGSCKAESGDVSVWSNLEDQLAEIRRHLLRSVEHAYAEP